MCHLLDQLVPPAKFKGMLERHGAGERPPKVSAAQAVEKAVKTKRTPGMRSLAAARATDRKMRAKAKRKAKAKASKKVAYRAVTPEHFRRALMAGKRKLPKDLRPYVTTYSLEEYRNMGAKFRVSRGGRSGFALKPDGDIISVFSVPNAKQGAAAIKEAKRLGGWKLDCFDGYLAQQFYPQFRFREVSRLKWDDKYAPTGWDFKKHGRPDVLFMELPKKVRRKK